MNTETIPQRKQGGLMEVLILTAILCVLAMIFTSAGCSSLDKGADPLVVRAEQFQTLSLATFDFVLGVDDSNRPFYRTNAPQFHQFCEWLRAPQPWGGTNLQRSLVLQWNVQTVKKAYKTNRENKDALELALRVGESALIQASGWQNSITNQPITIRQ